MANMYQQSQLRSCAYSNRGCTTTVRQEALFSHHQECGFAPVQCSYEGCEITVNRQDLASHQEICEFQLVTCEECLEVVRERDYEVHSCVLRRVFNRILQIDQLSGNIPNATRGQPGNNLVQPARQVTTPQTQQGTEIFQFETTQVEQVVTRRFASQVVGQPISTPRSQGNGFQLAAPSMSSGYFRTVSSVSNPAQLRPASGIEIVVAGGESRSYEIFNWSTQQWTLFEDALFFDHTDGFSFFYDSKVMFCGGKRTNRVECLDIANYRSVCTLPVQLPGGKCGKGVLCDDKIFTFGESVSATSLNNLFGSSVLVQYDDERKFSHYGIACVNDNAVVVGGNNSYVRTKYERVYDYMSQGYEHVKNKVSEAKEYTDDVALYHPSSNVMNTLAPLPYGLCDMAVVAHRDNIIILGGSKGRFERTCNDILMYNITKQQCSKLPNMLEKRLCCAAVIMEETIVVFGGESTNERGYLVSLSTAEYLVLGENLWKKLPPMHCGGAGVTACVLP